VLETTINPFIFHGYERRLTVSIGILSNFEDGEDVEILLKFSNITIYYIKETGAIITRVVYHEWKLRYWNDCGDLC
jgi:GGDEF domain-containing protein